MNSYHSAFSPEIKKIQLLDQAGMQVGSVDLVSVWMALSSQSLFP